MMERPSPSPRVGRALREAGIMQPESCSVVLKAFEDVQCEDFSKRVIAAHRLSTCLEYLRDAGHPQLLLNLLVLLLERGIAREIAEVMRAVAAAGEWVLEVPDRDISVGSKSKLKVSVSTAIGCGDCLHFPAADKRCTDTILKDFPDLASVAKAMFMTTPAHKSIEHPVELEKLVKCALMRMMVPVVSLNARFKKELAEDTSFVREVLAHAEEIRRCGDVAFAQAEMYFGSVMLIYHVMLEERLRLPALRGDLLQFVGIVLATATNRELITVAARMLIMLLPPYDPQGLTGSSLTVKGMHCRLDSSLLAMMSLGERLDESIRLFASEASEEFWKDDFARLEKAEFDALLGARFQSDEQAKSRATELFRIFSTPSTAPCYLLDLKKPKAKQNIECDHGQGCPCEAKSFPIKERLERRKCSRVGCNSLEAKGGTFQICGRCKRAVYCSRDCQKQAWKKGHKELCH